MLSGGIDSATALYWTIKQAVNVYSINIQYAHASYQEVTASRKLAKEANVKEHITITLPFYKEIQTRYHPPRSKTSPYVPARNIIFYGIAAAYAEALNSDSIIFGSNADDIKDLPDATPQFIKRMNELLETGTRRGTEGNPTKIINPLINHNKVEVLRLAMKMNVPLELTWSCYEDVEIPCGKCRGCQNRLNAFIQLGLHDPLSYA